MSECGAAIRDGGGDCRLSGGGEGSACLFERNVTASEAAELRWVYRLRDMLISQYAYLAAMLGLYAAGRKKPGQRPCIQTLRAKALCTAA